MGVDVVDPLQLRRGVAGRAQADRVAKPKRRLSVNSQIAMGLWVLLWLGYNTSYQYVTNPNFPSSATELIHGIRAFFPMLAGWVSVLLIMSRSRRVLSWVAGPLGLMLLYALTGLVATAAFLDYPQDGLYFGTNYLCIVLVLLAIVAVENPLPDLRLVLNTTWAIGSMFTLGLLGLIPFLGRSETLEATNGPVGVRAFTKVDSFMGMAGTRNTGFARYAAISALVALPWLWRKSGRTMRIVCALLFAASLYALIIANGRTEVLAFIVSAFLILATERAQRTKFLLTGIGAAALLGVYGFYHGFFLYFTRTGRVDGTLTGRTETWEEGWRILGSSPWVGLGFQADRLYLGIHMHNAFLHVLFQAGFVGGGAILLALAITWFYIIKYFFVHPPADKSLIPPEIPAVFLFVTISSITESTFAYFSAAWLLSAPIVAYVIGLDRHMRKISFKAYRERATRARMARLYYKGLAPALDVTPSPVEEEVETEVERKARLQA